MVIDSFVDMPIDHAQVQAAVERVALGLDASELHGLLAGHACAGGRTHRERLAQALALEVDDAEFVGLMGRMQDECMSHLDGLDVGLQPLLPPDGRPLRERADALVAWTRGFLGGFGLAGVQATELSADGREVLRDFGTIAASRPALEGAGEGSDADESAQLELVEYVRVGAMMLHAELMHARSADGTTR